MSTETTINTINAITRVARQVTITAGKLAIMAALTSSWNTLTPSEQQQFTKEIGSADDVTVTFTLAGENPRLIDSTSHAHTIGDGHPIARKYLHALSGYLTRINAHTIYEYEMWAGANKEGETYHRLHHTRQQLEHAHHQYQRAKTTLTRALAERAHRPAEGRLYRQRRRHRHRGRRHQHRR